MRMTYIDIVNQAIAFIEEHLDQDLTLEDLAGRHHLSTMHFYRIFRAVTNKTVKSYIDARRLTEAAKAIRQTDRKIIDIAFQYGFLSHESFTRSFSNMYGMSPSGFKRSSRALPYYERPHIVEREFKNVNKDVIVDFTYASLPAVTLTGQEIRFNPETEEGLGRVSAFVAGFVGNWITPNGVDRLYNVTLNNSRFPEEDIRYFSGFSAGSSNERESGELALLELPASQYAVFHYKEGMASVFQTAIHDLYKSISVSKLMLNPVGMDFMEVYESDYAETGAFYIYVPIV
ncbi:AraC family transcriptional regulator [Paenibacillus sp. tmac-D7]|uniref:AraC family transcriptional regulator n=1 Tax=Paenibacillus sp. tmac-D7 TaxID=2591462 RepID=UPI0011415AAB|nr:AraC family transcriptional regulator [Paenibacillus sp. tmac-D7]